MDGQHVYRETDGRTNAGNKTASTSHTITGARRRTMRKNYTQACDNWTVYWTKMYHYYYYMHLVMLHKSSEKNWIVRAANEPTWRWRTREVWASCCCSCVVCSSESASLSLSKSTSYCSFCLSLSSCAFVIITCLYFSSTSDALNAVAVLTGPRDYNKYQPSGAQRQTKIRFKLQTLTFCDSILYCKNSILLLVTGILFDLQW